MLLGLLLLLCVATVPVARGRLSNLGQIRFRWPGAVLSGLVLQILIISVLPEGAPELHHVLHLLSYALVAAFVLANVRLPGVALLGMGGGLNLAAILANGGVMPTSPTAIRVAGMSVARGHFMNSAAVSHPHLEFLGDIFAVPHAFPVHNVFSLGDLVILTGATVFLHSVCESRWVNRLGGMAYTGALQAYIAAICVGGAAAVLRVLHGGAGFEPIQFPLLLACVVALTLGDLLSIKVVVRGAEGEVTVTATIAFAALLAFGPRPATLAVFLASLAADLIRRKPPIKTLFNAGQYAIAIFVSGLVLNALTGVPRPHGVAPFLAVDMPGIVAAAFTYFVLNTGIVAVVIALVEGMSVTKYLPRDVLLQGSNQALLLGLSPIVVVVGHYTPWVLPLLLLPVVAIYRGQRQALLKEHQALHDGLTELPNRVLFMERVQQALEDNEGKDDRRFAVLLADVDHFKEVNDTLGHHHGDELLCELAQRFSESLGSGELVARLGGDEFGILLPDVKTDLHAIAATERVLESLDRPLVLDELALDVRASIGIALYPTDGESADELMRHADVAMYEAKRDGSGWERYEPGHDRHSAERLTLATEMRRAIDDGQFELHYQPKVEVATGRAIGVEALVRWNHPARGMVSPGEFIPLAERSGLITPLTAVVLEQAITQIRAWMDDGLDVSVAVNLSARSLLDQGLAGAITGLLERLHVPASMLECEITESMVMSDPERAREVLDRLTAEGIRMSVDDFGTGYSSLGQLKRLAVQELKIDRSFVTDMVNSPDDAAIVRATIELGHSLGLVIVAEGVEDQETLIMLREVGCDLAQGFFMSRPLSAEMVTPLLRKGFGDLVVAGIPQAA